MSTKKKKYSAQIKAKIALEAVRAEKKRERIIRSI